MSNASLLPVIASIDAVPNTTARLYFFLYFWVKEGDSHVKR